ncbi:MAG: DegT/DnrJ/EryC1/StrS family aminotransferase [Pyrinomonadaceae bacterium]|nr:DegT/DnrJ/EryC1/StrS family aminotransferase [Pyrinomonadaceae bacterium]
MSEWRIPLSDLDYGVEEEAAVLRVLRSKWLSMGPEVQAFEQEFAGYLGVKHALAVSNGTAALHLSYLALGLKSGDEVIQPAINFVAAANMTVAVGATPVSVDILNLSEPTIDPSEIERRISPQTKAVVVMHYGGYFCRMAEISSLCQKHNLALIEDACHAVGARYRNPDEPSSNGRFSGALGDLACFSFFSNKNLVTGEGGMITTNRDDLAERVRLLRSHGMTTLTWDRHRGHASSYDVILNGYNYRLDELRAALGRVQLQKLEPNNRIRRDLVAEYRRNLADLPTGWILPFKDYKGDSAYHLMTAVAPDEEVRRNVVQSLKNRGIQTSLHYPCLSDFEAFGHFQIDQLEQSRSFARLTITLPLFSTMRTDQVAEVCTVMRTAASEKSVRRQLAPQQN